MAERRRGLGRGLGALIPGAGEAGTAPAARRPVDVFFEGTAGADEQGKAGVAASEVKSTLTTSKSSAKGSSRKPVPAVTARTAASAAKAATPPAQRAATDQAGSGAGTGDSNERAAQATAGIGQATATTGQATDDDAQLVAVPGAEFAELEVAAIRPNPRQPRQVFDQDALDELAGSITEVGLLQPVVVRRLETPADDGAAYELIMGERRWRATQQAGLATIPAIIRDTADEDLLRDALLENLHRAQLNPLEEAAAYQQMLDDFGCTQEELAARVARSLPQISNTLRLLKLPALVQRRVAAGVLSAGHARALLGLADGAAMERLAQRIVAEGLSVRTVEELVALGGDEATQPVKKATARAGGRTEATDALQDRLSDRFETRVRVSLGKTKGRVTIEFASVGDLNRILETLAPGDPGLFR
jgi:ParB family chromosome partitioning protein